LEYINVVVVNEQVAAPISMTWRCSNCQNPHLSIKMAS